MKRELTILFALLLAAIICSTARAQCYPPAPMPAQFSLGVNIGLGGGWRGGGWSGGGYGSQYGSGYDFDWRTRRDRPFYYSPRTPGVVWVAYNRRQPLWDALLGPFWIPTPRDRYGYGGY